MSFFNLSSDEEETVPMNVVALTDVVELVPFAFAVPLNVIGPA